jgi:hypothetical protein
MVTATKVPLPLQSAVQYRLPNAIALQELEVIRQSNGGILQAETVVEAAADLESPLHGSFQWDDTEAARQWRIEQARRLIRSVLIMVPNYKKPVPVYISLKFDRMQPKGGYRTIIDVMSNKDQREMLIAEAMADLQTWQAKYAMLEELRPVFETISKTRQSLRRKK